LNSAELPEPIHFSSGTSQWDDVRRIYRRVCVLRITGKNDEATHLENTDLARALSEARIASSSHDDEASVLSEEAERVSNASVLAELLAPLLAEHLRGDAQPHLTPAPSIIEKSSTAARPPPEKAPSIADLLDGMLSQHPSVPPSDARH
jgi:hypothetical protein